MVGKQEVGNRPDRFWVIEELAAQVHQLFREHMIKEA